MDLSTLPIFIGLTQDEIQAIASYKNTVFNRCFKAGEHIYNSGQFINYAGIIINGSVNIENIDILGNKSILSNLGNGNIFAETYALYGKTIAVNVVAVTDCVITFINIASLLNEKNSSHSWYIKLLRNMLQISTEKNLTLSSRIFCTSAKNIRGRLLTYLSEQALKSRNTKFKIPFNRQQLADYLNVDRSALSKELSKMRTERIINFYKNNFEILKVYNF